MLRPDSLRILLVNFTMDLNSPVLGWQARVAYALAERCDKVVVFTTSVGEYKSHPNLVVKTFRQKKKVGFILANIDVFHAIREYGLNACFIHMAHHWAYKLFPAFLLTRTPAMLWYAHGHAPRSLQVADFCVNRVVTSTSSGYPLPSKKKTIIGQGIDTDMFVPPIFASDRRNILSFGRIAPRKRLDFLIDVFASLSEELEGRFDLYGPCLSDEDIAYKKTLNEKIKMHELSERIAVHDAVTMEQVPGLHKEAFLHFSASKTDSMDKTLLESLACGVPILTSNVAFKKLCADHPEFVFDHNDDVSAVADKVKAIYLNRGNYRPEDLRAMVVGKHDQSHYADQLIANLSEIRRD